MTRMNRLLLGISLALSSPSLFAVSFSVDPPVQSRSGLIRLRGVGFGDAGGSVTIGGAPAQVARWSNDLVECYVPLGARLGPVPVLARPTGISAASYAIMKVGASPAPSGRQKWRFKLADQYVAAPPKVGPDGTVYVIGNFGHLYAVSMQGILQWVVSPPGGVGGMVDILPNGDLVTGGGGGVQCLSRIDGRQLWSFPLNTPLVAGPNVGPDGNVYAVDDSRWSQDVIGAFILNPTGSLLWHGGKYYRRGGGWTPQPVQFGGGNAVFWSDYSSTGDTAVLGGLNAIFQGGGLRWRITDGVGILPGVSPTGKVSLFRPSTIEQHNPDGSSIWSQYLGNFGGQPQGTAIVAGDGRTYFLTTNTRVNAVTSTGQIALNYLLGGVISDLGVRSDAGQLVLEWAENYGVPCQIRAFSPSMVQQWSETLPIEYGTTISCYQQIVYDATGDTAYVGTVGPYTGAYEAHCYLYAYQAR